MFEFKFLSEKDTFTNFSHPPLVPMNNTSLLTRISSCEITNKSLLVAIAEVDKKGKLLEMQLLSLKYDQSVLFKVWRNGCITALGKTCQSIGVIELYTVAPAFLYTAALPARIHNWCYDIPLADYVMSGTKEEALQLRAVMSKYITERLVNNATEMAASNPLLSPFRVDRDDVMKQVDEIFAKNLEKYHSANITRE